MVLNLVLCFASTMETLNLLIRQVSIYVAMILIDAVLIAVETPLLSFTMESFNQKDRERIITGYSLFGGSGNILGTGRHLSVKCL